MRYDEEIDRQPDGTIFFSGLSRTKLNKMSHEPPAGWILYIG